MRTTILQDNWQLRGKWRVEHRGVFVDKFVFNALPANYDTTLIQISKWSLESKLVLEPRL